MVGPTSETSSVVPRLGGRSLQGVTGRQRCEQVQDDLVIHWLDQMRVETGFSRLLPILFLTPAGQRHDHQTSAPRLLANPATHFIAIDSRQSDVEQNGIRQQSLGSLDLSLIHISEP